MLPGGLHALFGYTVTHKLSARHQHHPAPRNVRRHSTKLPINCQSVLICAAAVGLVVVVVRALVALQGPEPLSHFADRVNEMLVTGRGEELYDYLPEQDRDNVSRDQFEAFIHWRNKCFQGYRITGKPVDREMRNGYGLMRETTYVATDGTSFQDKMMYDRGPQGPIVEVARMVSNSLEAKYLPNHLQAPKSRRRLLALSEGFRSEMPSLLTFGKGFFETSRVVEWVEMWVFVEQALTNIEHPMEVHGSAIDAQRSAIREQILSGTLPIHRDQL